MQKPAVFLDRDGVINLTFFRDGKPRAPDRIEDFKFFPGVADAVTRLRDRGFIVVVVTNQPDVARGWQTRERVEAMNQIVRDQLRVDDVKVCYHDDGDACICRKPQPGMLLEAAREFGIDLARSFMVGDRRIDIDAGRAAGCRASILIAPSDTDEFKPDSRVSTLTEAADWILDFCRRPSAGAL